MGSERLPGKVLRNAGGQPLLLTLIERLRLSRKIDDVAIATSTSHQDDVIEEFAQSIGCTVLRGEEHDVLSRVNQVLKTLEVDLHVECFGDSVLVAPELVDEFIDYFLHSQESLDFLSPARLPGIVIGSEFNVYMAHTLAQADGLVAPEDPLRQHVGFNIRRFPDKFHCRHLHAAPEFQGGEIALEVDYLEDLEVLDQLFQKCGPKLPQHISIRELVLLCESEPELIARTAGLTRHWKTLRNP